MRKKIIGILISVVITTMYLVGGFPEIASWFNLTDKLIVSEAKSYIDNIAYDKIDEDENGTYDYIEICCILSSNLTINKRRIQNFKMRS